ncbi:probable receptor-like protein kinase At1g80640 [Olea europaea var. sylvestris]|uniref:probable receptor-like protein kinase At1g80640 n=1 Tax=Olea europaea var. sylvestris TaxID=158386 RepID=UPI000C1D2652|nr:probable receptor-like protein kinase At1g80640 [Olea europaea var. sylvestris]
MKTTFLVKVDQATFYKDQFDNDFHAAVKKLSAGGQVAEREFKNEIKWLNKIQHQNIVLLSGYCIHGEGHYLAYELMHNGPMALWNSSYMVKSVLQIHLIFFG